VGGAFLQLAINVAGLTLAGIATLSIQSRVTTVRGRRSAARREERPSAHAG